MGDTTALQLYVTLPKELTEEVRKGLLSRISNCFAEYGFNYWRGSEEGPDGDNEYGWGAEAGVGNADELDTALRNLLTDEEGVDLDADPPIPVPEFAWLLWEDPAYEWLGQVHIHVPSHGYFTAECNSEGQPQFTAGEILRRVQEATSLDQLKTQLDEELGVSILAALETYRKENNGATV